MEPLVPVGEPPSPKAASGAAKGETPETATRSALECCASSFFAYVKLAERRGSKFQLRTLQIDYERSVINIGAAGAVLSTFSFWNIHDVLRDGNDQRRMLLFFRVGSQQSVGELRRYEVVAQTSQLLFEIVARLEDVLRYRGRRLGNQAQVGQVLKSGYVMKQGRRVYAKRYLLLFPHRLVVFKSDMDEFPPNVLELGGSTTIIKHPRTRLGIAVSFRIICFKWASELERDQWSEALDAAAKRHSDAESSYVTVHEQLSQDYSCYNDSQEELLEQQELRELKGSCLEVGHQLSVAGARMAEEMTLLQEYLRQRDILESRKASLASVEALSLPAFVGIDSGNPARGGAVEKSAGVAAVGVGRDGSEAAHTGEDAAVKSDASIAEGDVTPQQLFDDLSGDDIRERILDEIEKKEESIAEEEKRLTIKRMSQLMEQVKESDLRRQSDKWTVTTTSARSVPLVDELEDIPV